MSNQPNIAIFARDGLRAVFGEPQHKLGNAQHWSLPRPGTYCVNVTLRVTENVADVWVFDPFEGKGGAMNLTITTESQIEELITDLQRRVARAARPRPRRDDGTGD